MVKKWIFVAGAGIGYILGARAGRQKYDAMKAKAREVLDRPDVREATDAIQAEANRLYDEGRQLVRDRVKSIRERTEDNGDAGLGLDQSTSYASGARPEPISPPAGVPTPVPPTNGTPRS